MSPNVDTVHCRVTSFQPYILATPALMKAARSLMPLPATIGRIIGMPEKRAIQVEDQAEPETETRH